MRKQITVELLKKVAQQLKNGWNYHQLLSDETNKTCHGFYLTNRAGLYINIRYCYGENLPQWSIRYKHPKHDTMQTVSTIGCSIDKSLKSIVQDLENRLLTSTGLAYQKLAAVTEECQRAAESQQHNDFIIDALKKVMRLTQSYDHRYSNSWRVENDKKQEVATLHRYASQGNFRLTINDVNPAELIKIMQIINR
jgi:hypothetical protein